MDISFKVLEDYLFSQDKKQFLKTLLTTSPKEYSYLMNLDIVTDQKYDEFLLKKVPEKVQEFQQHFTSKQRTQLLVLAKLREFCHEGTDQKQKMHLMKDLDALLQITQNQRNQLSLAGNYSDGEFDPVSYSGEQQDDQKKSNKQKSAASRQSSQLQSRKSQKRDSKKQAQLMETESPEEHEPNADSEKDELDYFEKPRQVIVEQDSEQESEKEDDGEMEDEDENSSEGVRAPQKRRVRVQTKRLAPKDKEEEIFMEEESRRQTGSRRQQAKSKEIDLYQQEKYQSRSSRRSKGEAIQKLRQMSLSRKEEDEMESEEEPRPTNMLRERRTRADMKINSLQDFLKKPAAGLQQQQPPRPKAPLWSSDVKEQLKNFNTESLVHLNLQTRETFRNIPEELYYLIEWEDLPLAQMDLFEKQRFLQSKDLSRLGARGVDLVCQLLDELLLQQKQTFSMFQSQRLGTDKYHLYYDLFTKEQLLEFGQRMQAKLFLQEDVNYFCSLLRRDFYDELNAFLARFPEMTHGDLQDYFAFLGRLRDWTLNFHLGQTPITGYFLSKLAFLRLQVGYELDEYDEDVLLEYLRNPVYLQQQIQSFLVQVVDHAVQAYQGDIDSGVLLEGEPGLLNQIISSYLYSVAWRKYEANPLAEDPLLDYKAYFEENFLARLVAQVIVEFGKTENSKLLQIFSHDELELVKGEKFINFSRRNAVVERDLAREIRLHIYLKNIEEITVNFYVIDCPVYYQQHGQRFNEQISVDGIIPQFSKKFDVAYDRPGQRKHLELSFEDLEKGRRGIFLVEISGGAVVSRAVLRRGHLSYCYSFDAERQLHRYQLLDEQLRPLREKGAGLLLDYQRFEADGKGVVEFSERSDHDLLARAGPQAILYCGLYARLVGPLPRSEDEYDFQCAFLATQESFLRGTEGQVLVCPRLARNRARVPGDVLQDCKATVRLVSEKSEEKVFEYQLRPHLQNDLLVSFPIEGALQSATVEFYARLRYENPRADPQDAKLKDSERFIEKTFLKSRTFNLRPTGSGANSLEFNDFYLRFDARHGAVLAVVTKDGTGRAQIPVEVTLQTLHFSQQLTLDLETDQNGEVLLGYLRDCQSLTARVLNNSKGIRPIHQTFQLSDLMRRELYEVEFPRKIVLSDTGAPQKVRLPALPLEFRAADYNLVRLGLYLDSHQMVLANLSAGVQHDARRQELLLELPGAGHYCLEVHPLGIKVPIQVVDGARFLDRADVVYDARLRLFHQLTAPEKYLLRIDDPEIVQREAQRESRSSASSRDSKAGGAEATLTFRVHTSERDAARVRVWCFAHNFATLEGENWVHWVRRLNGQENDAEQGPEWRGTAALAESVARGTAEDSVFFTNKRLSGEHAYSVRRQFQEKLMTLDLEKPKLFLKQTFYQATSATQPQIQQESAFQLQRSQRRTSNPARKLSGLRKFAENHGVALQYRDGQFTGFRNVFNLEFLQTGCLVAQNLRLERGATAGEYLVRVPGLHLADYQNLVVLCENGVAAVQRSFYLPPSAQLARAGASTAYVHRPLRTREVRLMEQLEDGCGYQDRRDVRVLRSQESLKLIGQGEKQYVTDLEQIFDLFCQRRGHSELAPWQFLRVWPELKEDLRLALYDEFACHELNLYLFFKDRAFFDAHVRPFLQNKLVKTFVDHYLLQEQERIFWYWKIQNLETLNILELVLMLHYFVSHKQNEKAEKLHQLIAAQAKSLPEGQVSQMFDEIINLKVFTKQQTKDFHLNRYQAQASCADGSRNDTQPDLQDYFQLGGGGGAFGGLGGAFGQRKLVSGFDYSQFFQNPGAQHESARKVGDQFNLQQRTTQYVERNYIGQKNQDSNQRVVQLSAFWVELAAHVYQRRTVDGFFTVAALYRSPQFSVTEFLAMLALMDLNSGEEAARRVQSVQISSSEWEVRNQNERPVAVFYKDVVPVRGEKFIDQIYLVQKIFDPQDQFATENGLKIEKEVQHFQTNVVYCLKTIVSNFSATTLNLKVVVQVPVGSVPLQTNGEYFQIHPVTVEQHQFRKIELFFYFPREVQFTVYTANVLRDESIVARAKRIEPRWVRNEVPKTGQNLKNLDQLIREGDKQTILETLAKPDVLIRHADYYEFLEKDRKFFREYVKILVRKNIFDLKTWEKCFKYRENSGMAVDLLNNLQFQKRYLDRYQVLYFKFGRVEVNRIAFYEFNPLFNQRIHQIQSAKRGSGASKEIHNQQIRLYYTQFLVYLIMKRHALENTDHLVLCYYLILQDRFKEASDVFQNIREENSVHFRLQYDYVRAYLNIYLDGYPNFVVAREIVQKYENYQIRQWRLLFQEVALILHEYDEEQTFQGHFDELERKKREEEKQERLRKQEVSADTPAVADTALAQAKLYDLEQLDDAVHESCLKIVAQGIDLVQVDYYLIDIEAIFSQNPFFMSEKSFNFVKANHSEQVALSAANLLKNTATFDSAPNQQQFSHPIPSQYQNKNLYLTVRHKRMTKSLTVIINELRVNIIKQYGIVQVQHKKTQKPIPRAYVKVFVKTKSQVVQFFRDGYTDYIGRFDYGINKINENRDILKYVILVSSESQGLSIHEIEKNSEFVSQEDILKQKEGFLKRQSTKQTTVDSEDEQKQSKPSRKSKRSKRN